eukprot:10961616-Heterocapsa_arctica.AAC.1
MIVARNCCFVTASRRYSSDCNVVWDRCYRNLLVLEFRGVLLLPVPSLMGRGQFPAVRTFHSRRASLRWTNM